MKLIIKICDEEGNQLASNYVIVPDTKTPYTKTKKIDTLPDVTLVYEIRQKSDGAKIFGRLVKQYREKTQLTSIQLAEKCGIHVSFIRGIERGAQAPSLNTAMIILKETPLSRRGAVKWVTNPNCDLRLKDLETGEHFYFRFAAQFQGQNRRP